MSGARRAAIIVLVAFAIFALVTGIVEVSNNDSTSGIVALVVLAAVAIGGVFTLRAEP